MPAFVKLGDIKASSTNHVVVESESLILPTDGDDILVVKPEANDVLIGLDVGPVNKLADNGWWTVDGANFRDTQPDAQPEKESFGSFEPREAKFQEASTNDALTGRKGLYWGELCDVGTSLRQSDDYIKLGDIKGDRLLTTGGGGDSITGEGRATKVWTNGGASTFEDSNWIWQDCNDVKSDQDNNDVVIGVRENIDWTAANGGPGSSYLTAKTASKTNAYVDEDVDGFMKLGDIKGELQTTDLRSDSRFVIERFEPAAGMDSFGESLNSALELGSTSFMTGNIGVPNNNITGSASAGGDDI